jgi:hypothetical protein
MVSLAISMAPGAELFGSDCSVFVDLGLELVWKHRN